MEAINTVARTVPLNTIVRKTKDGKSDEKMKPEKVITKTFISEKMMSKKTSKGILLPENL